MATNEFTPTTDSNSFAFKFLQEELEMLLALSFALTNYLEPDDPSNPEDGFNSTPWRLSQVLEDRLSSVEFSNNMKILLLGAQA